MLRELATHPVGTTDYLLMAAQGIGNFLALYRTEGAGAHMSVAQILANSFAFASNSIVIVLMGFKYHGFLEGNFRGLKMI